MLDFDIKVSVFLVRMQTQKQFSNIFTGTGVFKAQSSVETPVYVWM